MRVIFTLVPKRVSNIQENDDKNRFWPNFMLLYVWGGERLAPNVSSIIDAHRRNTSHNSAISCFELCVTYASCHFRCTAEWRPGKLMHIQQSMGWNTSKSVMGLLINMGESDYKFLRYRYLDLKFLIIIRVSSYAIQV